MRVVLDTNVIVSAFLSPRGAPAQVLQSFRQGVFDMLVSPAILREYRAALRYDRVRKVHKLTEAQLESALEDLQAVAILVTPTVTPAVFPADAEDDKFFACAVVGHADIIVSGDAHVQGIGQYQGIPVLSPAVFVALLDQTQA